MIINLPSLFPPCAARPEDAIGVRLVAPPDPATKRTASLPTVRVLPLTSSTISCWKAVWSWSRQVETDFTQNGLLCLL